MDVEQQDWEATEPPMDRANVDVREVKPIVEPNAEIILGQLFQLKAVTIHTVSEVYLQMRRYLQSIYNSEWTAFSFKKWYGNLWLVIMKILKLFSNPDI